MVGPIDLFFITRGRGVGEVWRMIFVQCFFLGQSSADRYFFLISLTLSLQHFRLKFFAWFVQDLRNNKNKNNISYVYSKYIFLKHNALTIIIIII